MPNLRKQFSVIYEQYINKIYRFVFLKVGTEAVAQDIASEVFVRAWDRFKAGKKQKGAEQASGIENIQAFLYRIARNLVVDYYRQNTRFKTVSVEEIWKPDSRIDLNKDAEVDSEMNQLRFALSKINETYADVVVWRYLDQFSISEIAKILNKSEGAIRVLLFRGLKDLRDQMEKQEKGEV